VQLMASHPPPASCQQAWDRAEAAASSRAMALLVQLLVADPAQAGRAVAAGTLLQLTRVLRWAAPRLEWLGRQGLCEEAAEVFSVSACSGLLLLHSEGVAGADTADTSAAQAGLPQLVQQVLQHCRIRDTLRVASQLLALLRDPGGGPARAATQGAAKVLRQLQPGGQPGRAAAIAALLSEVTGEERRQAGGSGAGAAPAQPSSSGGAAQQAGAQKEAVPPAECATCHALPPAGRKFQVCAGCRAVRYCSPACQKAGWRSGHKAACRAAQGGAQGGA
jgi:hypothetical protein